MTAGTANDSTKGVFSVTGTIVSVHDDEDEDEDAEDDGAYTGEDSIDSTFHSSRLNSSQSSVAIMGGAVDNKFSSGAVANKLS